MVAGGVVKEAESGIAGELVAEVESGLETAGGVASWVPGAVTLWFAGCTAPAFFFFAADLWFLPIVGE